MIFIQSIIFSAALFLPIIVISLVKNKMSKPMLFSLLLLCDIVILVYPFVNCIKLLERILIGICLAISLFTNIKIIVKSELRFGNYQIMSFSYLYNKLIYNKNADKKKVGFVIPFSKTNLKYGGRIITYPEINSRGGTMITGASGSGKSVQAMELIRQDMSNGRNVVFFDFKGERSTAAKIEKYAKQYGYEIYSMADGYEFSFDPLYDMSSTAKVEAILNTRRWSMDGSDAHFRTNTQLLIQKYVKAFDEIFYNADSELYTYNLYRFIKANKPDLSNRAVADAYKTFETLLEVILTSKLGPSLKGKYNRQFSFSKAEKYNEKYVMIISIASDSKEFANSISSFYFRNIMSTGTNNEFTPAMSLYVDEFGSLENPFVIKDILEKGRSCGIMTTIIMQDIFQIVINTNEAYLNSLLGTVNNFMIFAGATREAAVKMAGVQIKEVDGILQTLLKPLNGNPPTACLITKIPILDDKKASEVLKYIPYVEGQNNNLKGGQGRTESEINDDVSSINNELKSTSDMTFDDFVAQNSVSKPKMTSKEKHKSDDNEFLDFLDDMEMFGDDHK